MNEEHETIWSILRQIDEEANNNFVSITATITPEFLEELRNGNASFNEVEWVVIPCDQEGQY